MNRRAIRSTVTGLVIVTALIVAWRASVHGRELASAADGFDRERATIERQIAKIDTRRAEIARSETVARAAAQMTAPAAEATANAEREDWARMEKLARNDLKMVEIRAKRRQAELYFRYAAFFHSRGMTPERIEQFKTVKTEHWLRREDINFAAETQSLARNDPAIAQLLAQEEDRFQAELKDVLGAQGLSALDAFEKSDRERMSVDRLTAVLSDTPNPISRQQAEELTEALLAARVPRSTNPNETQIDWAAAEIRARSILSPTQMTEFHSATRITRRSEALSQIFDLYIAWRKAK